MAGGSEDTSSGPPPDRYRLVYWTFCLLGVGVLLPWNVFITKKEYFDARVHAPPAWQPLADNFELAIVLAFQATNALAFPVLIPCQPRLSLRQQVTVPFLATQATLALAAATALLQLSGNAVMALTLGSAGLLGVTCAVASGGVFTTANRFPPVYIQAVQVGLALSGVALSLLSFFTVWASPPAGPDPTPGQHAAGAFAFFTVAAAVMGLATVGFGSLPRIPFAQHYWAQLPEVQWPLEHHRKRQMGSPHALRQLDTTPDDSSDAQQADSIQVQPLLGEGQRPSDDGMQPPTESSQLASYSAASRDDGAKKQPGLWWMLHRLRGDCFVICYTFVVTLAAFPGVTSSICSAANPARRPPCAAVAPGGRLYGDLFVPLSFVIFNLGDIGGRALAAVGPWRTRAPRTAQLVAYALGRTALLAALPFCNVVTQRAWALPALLRADVWPVGLTLLLGLTNGHLASVALMHAPARLPPSARTHCGPITQAAVTSGCTLGALASLALMSLLQRG